MPLGSLSRRGFLQHTTLGLAASGLPLWNAREIAAAALQADKPLDITMGAIGIGSPQSRGRAIYGDAKRVKGVRYVAACDVDARHLKTAVEKDLPGKGDKDAKGFKDFRELLDRKDIQAVTIATPDQWHALVAIDALKKGKDVYLEKPLTLTIGEAIAMAERVVVMSRRPGRIKSEHTIRLSSPDGRRPTPFAARSAPEFNDYFKTLWEELEVHVGG